MTCQHAFARGRARDAKGGCHLSAAAPKPREIPLRAPLCPLASHRNYTWARLLHAQLGRFVNRDPVECDDSSAFYSYAGDSPIDRADPLGLDWLDNSANLAAGFADSLTMGVHGWVRSLIGINDGIDAESGWYITGEATEITVEVTLTLGAAASRHVAKRVVRSAVEGGARTAYRRLYKIEGGIISHHIPIKGHIGGKPSYFPLPYKFAARARWNMSYVSNVAEHAAMHRRLIQQEQYLKYFTFTQPIRNGGNLLIQHVLNNAPDEIYQNVNNLPFVTTSVRFSGRRTLYFNSCTPRSNDFEYSAKGSVLEIGMDYFQAPQWERW